MPEDRRRFERAKFPIVVRWRCLTTFAEGDASLPDLAEDISAGGVCLVLYDALKVGDEIELQFSLLGKGNIQTKARVVWVRQAQMFSGDYRMVKYYAGLEFIEMSQKDKEFINQIIARLKRNPEQAQA
ncbi:MAG: PilZ domain-containing protein [Candidatus Omnitrophica bacterium]|nr:PilZ domain-containing protein [Candidatus Omnitrophota bacterium]